MEVIAVRPLTIDGKSYSVGDAISGLPPDKIAQLVAQRQLKPKDEGSREYVALRSFSIRDKKISRGQIVKVSRLSTVKLHQLLEQRYLEPAPPK